jgi:RNA polymerase sigma-70 factor (ECF subfamily)
MERATEGEYIKRAKRGDKEAFALLINAHKAFVYHLALGILKDRQEAEDLTQEVFIRVYENLRFFRGQSRFSVWLGKVAYNMSLNRLKALKRLPLAIEEENLMTAGLIIDTSNSPLAQIEEKERREILKEAFSRLPEIYQLPIMLRYMQGFSVREVADILNLPQGTVKTRLARARNILRRKLSRFSSKES